MLGGKWHVFEFHQVQNDMDFSKQQDCFLSLVSRYAHVCGAESRGSWKRRSAAADFFEPPNFTCHPQLSATTPRRFLAEQWCHQNWDDDGTHIQQNTSCGSKRTTLVRSVSFQPVTLSNSAFLTLLYIRMSVWVSGSLTKFLPYFLISWDLHLIYLEKV